MNNQLTHKEMSSRGGKSKLARYGREQFIEMQKKGVEAAKAKYGKAYLQHMYLKQLETRFKESRMTVDKYEIFKKATLEKIARIENGEEDR
jgi:hypothetical protein